jgi:hypothetical protein
MILELTQYLAQCSSPGMALQALHSNAVILAQELNQLRFEFDSCEVTVAKNSHFLKDSKSNWDTAAYKLAISKAERDRTLLSYRIVQAEKLQKILLSKISDLSGISVLDVEDLLDPSLMDQVISLSQIHLEKALSSIKQLE